MDEEQKSSVQVDQLWNSLKKALSSNSTAQVICETHLATVSTIVRQKKVKKGKAVANRTGKIEVCLGKQKEAADAMKPADRKSVV